MSTHALALPDTTDPLLEKDLPKEAREDLEYWRRLLRPAMDHRGRGLRAILKRLAVMSGQSFPTVRARYYAWRDQGVLGLVDKRLAGAAFWTMRKERRAPAVSESRGLQQLWCSICESNQRKSKPEFDTFVRMWKERDKRIAEIPEYADFPGWPELPEGFSYKNLMRYGPTELELTAARQGRFAAARHRPTVFTTRAGLYVGSHLMLDDKWHDFFVNSFADGKAGRPLELYTFDLFSARKVRWGIRVRLKKSDGSYEGLPEEMTRYVLASHLFQDGYSPRGTTLVAEHGTAAVRERIARALFDMTKGKIVLSESGMTGDPAHLGQYPGLVKGNPRHKAALESNNNREHNAFGSLPAQTGNCVENRPEQLDGQLDNNAALLAAYAMLPAEKAQLLEFSLLELNQFMSVADHVYAHLERSREHELEGWIEAGNVVQAIELGGQQILETALSPEQRANLPALLGAGLVQARPMRMSRREVWDRGVGELVRLPGWGVCEILGEDLARESTVRAGMFEIQDLAVGPGTYRFGSRVIDAEGRQRELHDGEKYQTFINPFALGTLFVRDAKGRYVGEARAIHAPSRAEFEAVQAAMGAAAKREAQLLAPLRARHDAEAREKHRRQAANVEAMENREAQAPKTTPSQRDRNAERAAALAKRAAEQMESQGGS
jgi:hypothetical protein